MKEAIAKIKDVVPENFFADVQITLGKREQLWKECVDQAKILVRQYKEIRFTVVELALKCCVIHHGGRAANERFTIKRFAQEVGMKEKTLNEWIRIKINIYNNLPEDEKLNTSYEDLRYLDKQMKGQNRQDVKRFSLGLSKRLIEMKAKHACTIKMEKYLKHLKTIQFNVENQRMIKDCDIDVLIQILSICRSIVLNLSKLDKKEIYANVE